MLFRRNAAQNFTDQAMGDPEVEMTSTSTTTTRLANGQYELLSIVTHQGNERTSGRVPTAICFQLFPTLFRA